MLRQLLYRALCLFALLKSTPVTSETVNADNGLYHDTGNGPCTRRVTVGGEADCYYSLKRLMSGTGIVNMKAKGLFQNADGELVKYASASTDGEWSLESLPDLRLAKSLHVGGGTRGTRDEFCDFGCPCSGGSCTGQHPKNV